MENSKSHLEASSRRGDRLLDICYRTSVTDYERIRKGIIQRKAELEESGYLCQWKGDLDLENFPSILDLRERGYRVIYDGSIKTQLHKENLFLELHFHPTDKKVSLNGESTIYEDQYAVVRSQLDRLEKISQIPFEIKRASNPY
jgi:hypothetical protein